MDRPRPATGDPRRAITASGPGDPRFPGFPPEVPPWPPRPPGPATPPVPVVPVPGSSPADDWRARVYGDLLDRRTVVLDGELDETRATLVAAQLLALDADRAEPITVVVNSPGGPLDAATAVLDTIDLITVPVDTTCLGQAAGTAAIVLAAGTGRRRAGASAQIRLRLPDLEVRGTAAHLADEAAHLERVHATLVDRLARATGQERQLVQRDVAAGRSLTADEARDYGIVDEVAVRAR